MHSFLAGDTGQYWGNGEGLYWCTGEMGMVSNWGNPQTWAWKGVSLCKAQLRVWVGGRIKQKRIITLKWYKNSSQFQGTRSWFHETRRNVLLRCAVVGGGTIRKKVSEVNTREAHWGLPRNRESGQWASSVFLSLGRWRPWASHCPVSLSSILCSLARLWGGVCSHAREALSEICACGVGSWF